MKVSVKTTRYLIAVNCIYTVLAFITIWLNIAGISKSPAFVLVREVFFMLPVIYMLWVLRSFHEKKSIIITFIIFIICDILLALSTLVVIPSASSAFIYMVITVLFMILLTVLTVQLFGLRNKELINPYTLFVLSYLGFTGLSMLAIFFFAITGLKTIYHISFFSFLVIPTSLFYCLIKISKYIAAQDKLNDLISEFGKNE